MKANDSITELCQALSVAPSGYYRFIKQPESKRRQENKKLFEQMTIIHSHPHTRCYGSPRMTRQLWSLGFHCSENRVARVMRFTGLRARLKGPFRPKTTQLDHAACPSPNLFSKEKKAQAPGQLARQCHYSTIKWLCLVFFLPQTLLQQSVRIFR